MKKIFYMLVLFYAGLLATFESKKFVILIATYNNEKCAEWNLRSALDQQYDHYRIMIINDASTDKTREIIEKIIATDPKGHLIALINNIDRQGALYNHYHTIHNYIEDDEIVVILDGDDALMPKTVLTKLNRIYNSTKNEVWMTYGQYKELVGGGIGFNAPCPEDIIKNNNYRKWNLQPSHLRTFYAWLFKRIKAEDLMLEGKFYEMCADLAVMLPLIEMAGNRAVFIKQILYIYNNQNPISDHYVNNNLQRSLAHYIRSLPRYMRLEHK